MAIQAAPVRIENNVVSGANATRVAGRGAEQVMGNVPGGAPWRQVAGMMGEIASWLVPSGAMGVKVVPLPNV